MKVCSRCLEYKSEDDFHKCSKNSTGLKGTCKLCRKEEEKKYRQGKYLLRIKDTQKLYRDKNKDKASINNKKNKVKLRYDITVEQYDSCMKSSKCCSICGSTTKLVFDHDHNKSGIESFRGVLCNNCNAGIGYLKDSIELLENAIVYLKEQK